MSKIDWFSRLPKDQSSHSGRAWLTGSGAIAALLLSAGFLNAGFAAPQTPAPATATASVPAASDQVVENGYVVHQTADLGGHLVGVSGSGAMYNTLVNIHSGPRVLGQTLTLTPAAGSTHPLMDSLQAFSNGFGGDPNNVVRLDFSKGKYYKFHGLFRRDRQYFDYDLLGNPSVPAGITIPYGMTATGPTTASLAVPQITQSPVMFNTVRRMTDTDVTFLPLSKVSFRVAYSQNIFQGPTLSPGRSIGKYDLLLAEYQRNSTDDFTGAIDWKPFRLTRVTFEEQVDHYKADSYFTLDPSRFNVQEADGTQGTIGNWYATANPYTISACNATGAGASMGSAYSAGSPPVFTILSAPQTAGGLPILNPACDVTTSYLRSQPTRVIYPTETVRLQSSSIKKLAMNGSLGYTISNSSLANYYENIQGLDGVIRNVTFTGNAHAQRRMVNAEFGITWDATRAISFSDQFDFSNLHQPGYANITQGITQNTPATAGNETIAYSGALVAGSNFSVSGNPSGTPLYAYFGQRFLTNNATVSWDASSRMMTSLTYRYRTHMIVQTSGTGPTANIIYINENGGIFNAAYRPTSQWRMNGTVEILYDDNAFTPIGPRQTKHYRLHTVYKPKAWATVSGSYNDLERHNNTNNTGVAAADGPLNHVDYSRVVGLGVMLAPNEHYGVEVSYAYSDIYTATNICYLSGATASLAGTASTTSTGAPNLCPNTLTDWAARDFMSAPTQYASVGANYLPNMKIRTAAGYRVSAVDGNQFFAVAQQVNGSLHSTYQSPYFNVAWTIHPGLIWRAEYNYYGYGEGGPSGAPFCSTSTATTTVVVPCSSPTLPGSTGLTESSSGLSAPRNTHANILTLAIHYEY